MLYKKFPHFGTWLPKFIISSCNNSLNLNSDIFGNVLYFLLDICCFGLSYRNTFLISKYDNFISIIIKFFQLLWNRLMPIYPISCTSRKLFPTFSLNQCTIHIKTSNFLIDMRDRLTNDTTFNIFPSPFRKLLFLSTFTFAHLI